MLYALTAFASATPDVLVSDISLPEKDGYELIQEIRAREAERGGYVPVVAVTGWARAQDRARALAAGFQLQLTKPVSLDGLVVALVLLVGGA